MRTLISKTFITGRLRPGSHCQEMGKFGSQRPATLILAASHSNVGDSGRTPGAAGKASSLPAARAIVACPQPHTGPISGPNTGLGRQGLTATRLVAAATRRQGCEAADRPPSTGDLGALSVHTRLLPSLPVSATALSVGLTSCR